MQDYLQAIDEGTAELESLLTEECQWLARRGDPEALADLAMRKAAVTHKLNQLEARRLQQPDNAAELPVAILDRLGRCQELNQRAGAHIAAQTRYASRALEVLGLAAGGRVYHADGSEHAVNASNNLGTA